MSVITIGRQGTSVAILSAIFVWGCHDCTRNFLCPSIDGAASTSSTGEGGSGGSGGASGSGGTGGGYVCPDDPSDGEVRQECGIWVSATHGDDQNGGTQAAPVKTITAAIVLARNGPVKRIYACGEEYPEPVALPAGISLFGGFYGCNGEGAWIYELSNSRATLSATPGVHVLTLLEGDARSLIAEVNIVAADAIEPGGSSIAVFAPEQAKAEFRRSKIIAGNGADGMDGEPGNFYAFAAQQGLPGLDGAGACMWDLAEGGAEVALQCESGGVTKGGKGGFGGDMVAGPGGEGAQPPDPNDLGYGLGGKPESGAPGSACTGGMQGAQGEKGADGAGAPAGDLGRITPDGHYVGVTGTDGEPGKPGQGGGGGGGARGKAQACGAQPAGGASGGSGGTGGCGGRGGKGGQAGGSSIGIAARRDRDRRDPQCAGLLGQWWQRWKRGCFATGRARGRSRTRWAGRWRPEWGQGRLWRWARGAGRQRRQRRRRARRSLGRFCRDPRLVRRRSRSQARDWRRWAGRNRGRHERRRRCARSKGQKLRVRAVAKASDGESPLHPSGAFAHAVIRSTVGGSWILKGVVRFRGHF